MNSVESNTLRKTAWQVYDCLREDLIFNRPDIEIKGAPFNSALLMSFLTGLCHGKELIIGEPGLGKTTSAEYVCALLYRFPLEVIWKSEVSGHPEQTEEKSSADPIWDSSTGEMRWSSGPTLPCCPLRLWTRSIDCRKPSKA